MILAQVNTVSAAFITRWCQSILYYGDTLRNTVWLLIMTKKWAIKNQTHLRPSSLWLFGLLKNKILSLLVLIIWFLLFFYWPKGNRLSYNKALYFFLFSVNLHMIWYVFVLYLNLWSCGYISSWLKIYTSINSIGLARLKY